MVDDRARLGLEFARSWPRVDAATELHFGHRSRRERRTGCSKRLRSPRCDRVSKPELFLQWRSDASEHFAVYSARKNNSDCRFDRGGEVDARSPDSASL